MPSLSPIRRQQLPQDFGRTVCATVDDESMLVAQQDGVSLVDLQTFQVTGSIPISGTLHVRKYILHLHSSFSLFAYNGAGGSG